MTSAERRFYRENNCTAEEHNTTWDEILGMMAVTLVTLGGLFLLWLHM